MPQETNTLYVDIDGTLCPIKKSSEEYRNLYPDQECIAKLHEWKNRGFKIILYTSRNMRTHKGDLAKIHKFTAPVLIEWLKKHKIPYDDIVFGKPWPGPKGFYVDDRTVRPSEFLSMSPKEIDILLYKDRCK